MRRFATTVSVIAAASLLAGSGPDGQPASSTQVAETYLRYLGSGHPQQAVTECVDTHEFARRLFGEDLTSLDTGRAGYVDQLVSLSLISAFRFGDDGAPVPGFTHSSFKLAPRGDDAIVSFTLSFPVARSAGAQGTTVEPANTAEQRASLVMHRSGDQWKIVELRPLTERWKSAYTDAHATPDAFAERLAAEVLQTRLKEARSAHVAREGRVPAVVANLARARNAIELYQVEHDGKLPDLGSQGWKVLIDGHYLMSGPVNPVTGSSTISVAGKQTRETGWIWDPSTGEIRACGFDEAHAMVTPDAP